MVNSTAKETFNKLEKRYNIKYFIKDTIVVSYPKSGRTWLRMLLAKLLVNMGHDHTKSEMLPVFHKSYKEIADLFSKDIKVLFLHRHPADVIASHWSEISTSMRSGEVAILGEYGFHNFMKNKSHGIKQLIEFNNEWLTNFHKFKNFKTMTYEEMKEDTFRAVKKVVKFIDLNCTDTQIKDAIEYCKFENMQKIEKGEGTNYLQHYKGNFAQELTKEHILEDAVKKGIAWQPRIRKGKVRGYLQELNKDDIEYLHKYIKNSIYKYD